MKWTCGTCLDERFDGGKRLVDDEVVGNEGLDIHDDIVAYDDDRSCADYRLVLHDELHVWKIKQKVGILDVCIYSTVMPNLSACTQKNKYLHVKFISDTLGVWNRPYSPLNKRTPSF